jgi:hypothetical protein
MRTILKTVNAIATYSQENTLFLSKESNLSPSNPGLLANMPHPCDFRAELC